MNHFTFSYQNHRFFGTKSKTLVNLAFCLFMCSCNLTKFIFTYTTKTSVIFHTAVSLPKADSEVSERKQQQSEGGSQPQYLVGKNSMLISNSTCKQSKNVKNSQSRSIQSRLKSSLVTLFCLGTHRLF